MIFIKTLNFILAGSLSLGLLAEPAFAESDVVLHFFQGSPNDGAGPMARLIRVYGEFYGTTSGGGANGSCPYPGCGTLFKMTKEGVVTVLHSFGGTNDGMSPQAGLLDVGGVLYGTTYSIGPYDASPYSGPGNCCGTVFKSTKRGVEKIVHSFRGPPDGANPTADLILVDGTLYGTTSQGGTGSCGAEHPPYPGCGTVFKMTKEGVVTVLHSFQGAPADGAIPVAGLINVGGTLYGTTQAGGNGCGTVFQITTEGVVTMLHKFEGGNRGNHPCGPKAGLINVGGVLYGTAFGGGSFGYGTVFKITTAGVVRMLYSFKGGIDGANPASGLLDVGGVLYGTTSQDGTGTCMSSDSYTGCGTVFKITTQGVATVLHTFKGLPGDGANPVADLINVEDMLYGTTFDGGGGTVFKMRLP